MKTPRIIYHRLVRLSEIEKVVVMPIDGIELDLRMTRDGTIVIHHDRRVQHGNSRYYWIDRLTFKELLEVTGDTFTFEEFLKAFVEKVSVKRQKELLLDLDIKQPGMEKQINLLLTRYSIRNVLVCSPDVWVLKTIEDAFPEAFIGLTYYPLDKWDLANNRAFRYFSVLVQYSLKPFLFRLVRRRTKKSDIEIASLHHKLVNEKVVSFLHQYDIQVFTWGTDQEKRLNQLVELGVDGIKTKNPDLLSRIIGDHENHR